MSFSGMDKTPSLMVYSDLETCERKTVKSKTELKQCLRQGRRYLQGIFEKFKPKSLPDRSPRTAPSFIVKDDNFISKIEIKLQ